jgi:hypothetical protein
LGLDRIPCFKVKQIMTAKFFILAVKSLNVINVIGKLLSN